MKRTRKGLKLNMIAAVCLSGVIMLSTAYAQYGEWEVFANYEFITAIACDDSFAWVGTTGGLVRIGLKEHDIKRYNTAADASVAKKITCIAIDEKNTMWLGTAGGGLVRHNSSGWRTFTSENAGLPDDHILSLACQGDTIWAGTENAGIFCFDGSVVLHAYNKETAGLPGNWVNDLAVAGDGAVWAVMFGGAACFNHGTWEMYSRPDLPDLNVYSVCVDNGGDVWIGTHAGLALFRADTVGSMFVVPPYPIKIIHAITADSSNNKYFGSTKGLAVLSGDEWITYTETDSVLPNVIITALGEDPEGDIWVGTERGLAVLKRDGSWEYIDFGTADIPGNSVQCLAMDSTGRIWTGTENYGLGILDAHTWSWYTTENFPLQSSRIQDITVSTTGIVYVGAGSYQDANGNLVKIDGDTARSFDKTNSALPGYVVEALHIDANGTLWMGTGELYQTDDVGGIGVMEGDSITHIYNEGNSGLLTNRVNAIAEDRTGALWFGLPSDFVYPYGHGIIRYDRDTTWTLDNGFSEGVSFNPVNCITVGPDNRIWVGSNHGGMGVLEPGGSWTIYNKSNSELPDDRVYAIAFDRDGVLWVGTINGLVRIEDDAWTVLTMANSGLPFDKIKSILVDRDNRKWIGTTGAGMVTCEVCGKNTGIKDAPAAVQPQVPARMKGLYDIYGRRVDGVRGPAGLYIEVDQEGNARLRPYFKGINQ